MNNNQARETGLRKEISQLGFGAIALNGTIGAGIFALPAIAVEYAGLFSNANDVAKIMQMYLQGGYYGGDRFMDSRTVEKFNRCYFCNRDVRRGVGFDKPQLEETVIGKTHYRAVIDEGPGFVVESKSNQQKKFPILHE